MGWFYSEQNDKLIPVFFFIYEYGLWSYKWPNMHSHITDINQTSNKYIPRLGAIP